MYSLTQSMDSLAALKGPLTVLGRVLINSLRSIRWSYNIKEMSVFKSLINLSGVNSDQNIM